jgi:hypothetical protein
MLVHYKKSRRSDWSKSGYALNYVIERKEQRILQIANSSFPGFRHHRNRSDIRAEASNPHEQLRVKWSARRQYTHEVVMAIRTAPLGDTPATLPGREILDPTRPAAIDWAVGLAVPWPTFQYE